MKTGIGLRSAHHQVIAEQQPAVGFLEAHSENYFGDTPFRSDLLMFREHYPVSLHGVGLSLGRADNLDETHLMQLKQLVEDVDPLFVSEHMSWSAYSHRHLPDLLPLPLIKESFDVMCAHVEQMQEVLQRQILVENPSNYLAFEKMDVSEPEFLNQLSEKTGCGLLLDINNIHVSAFNLGGNAHEYIKMIDSKYIAQYHLAGYIEQSRDNDIVLIDTHDHPVYPEVWELFEFVLATHGDRPTLFEWDSHLPDLSVLLAEAKKADQIKMAFQSQEHDMENIVFAAKSDKASISFTELAGLQTRFIDNVLANNAEIIDIAANCHTRLSVYENNVFGGLHDYLQSVFPATQGVVGDDFFRFMCKEFVRSHPPGKGNIHYFGDKFADFSRQFTPLQEVVYVGDLMSFEWAQHSAFYADIDIQRLVVPLKEDQDAILNWKVGLNSSVFLLNTPYPISEIYRQSLPDYADAVNVSLEQGEEMLLIYKNIHQQESVVKVERIDHLLLDLLNLVEQTACLHEVIEELSAKYEPQNISQALAYTLKNQLLIKQ